MPTQENKRRSYRIIGAGAVGAFYGASLQKAGFEIHYLFKDAYYSHVCQHGMQIILPEKDIILPKINAYKHAQEMPVCDVLIIALKTTQNTFLREILPSLEKDGSILLILQNGVGNEEEVSKIIPDTTILAGITTIGAYKEGPGKVYIFKEGLLKVAHYQDSFHITEQVRSIVEDFNEARIETLACEDYLYERFQKLLWNVCFNGPSVIYSMTADKIIESHSELLRRISEEFIKIAASYNRKIPFSSIEKILAFKQGVMGYKPSMLVDYEAKKPMEIEYIYEKLILLGKAKGIDSPILEKIYKQLKELEKN